jgi:hypothetical protein
MASKALRKAIRCIVGVLRRAGLCALRSRLSKRTRISSERWLPSFARARKTRKHFACSSRTSCRRTTRRPLSMYSAPICRMRRLRASSSSHVEDGGATSSYEVSRRHECHFPNPQAIERMRGWPDRLPKRRQVKSEARYPHVANTAPTGVLDDAPSEKCAVASCSRSIVQHLLWAFKALPLLSRISRILRLPGGGLLNRGHPIRHVVF